MEWKTAWSYLPIHYNTTIGTIENITQRTFFWNNLSGEKIKLKFSNLYGSTPLILDKVVIGKSAVTYQGQERIVIQPGAEFYSDEISCPVVAGEEITISMYVKEKTEIGSACSNWSTRAWHTIYGLDGDHTLEQDFEGKKSREVYPYVEADANKADIIFGICEILVLTEEAVQTMTLFGDSITHMSYYSDALCEQLYNENPGTVTIVNRGIGGNRVLHDATFMKEMPGEGKCFGRAAVERFERDVFGREVPDTIIFLEGVNDLMHPYLFECMEDVVTAEDLASGVTKFIELAHQKGAKFFLGTIMPFKNDEMQWLPEAEAVRNAYNDWVRHQNIADGFIDFDLAIRDPKRPEYMREGTHIGDGLHPNKEGGIVMKNAACEQHIVG